MNRPRRRSVGMAAALGVMLVCAGRGPVALGGTTERVSAASDGTQGNAASASAAISADGRYAAFRSAADNLVPDDTNGETDIFVHDRQTRETTRVSVASNGAESDSGSDSPQLSADGRFVAFSSGSNTFDPRGGRGVFDIFVHDRQTGETTLVSVAADGGSASGQSVKAAINGDGRFVGFRSTARNLTTAADLNDAQDIFVRDRQAGQTALASVASDGTQANADSDWPAISGNGRFVAFESEASNLVPGDTNGVEDIFVHDLHTGQTTRVSVASDGTEGNARSEEPSISGDGRFVAFTSYADNLVPGDTNTRPDIFVHDRATGQTTRVNVAPDGAEANRYSWNTTISADGRFVVFDSAATNLVPGDTNEQWDTFVHDRVTGEVIRASVASDGTQADNGVWKNAISADGRVVAFQSRATTLVTPDTNPMEDIFVHDRGTTPTTLAHVDDSNTTGTEDGTPWNPFHAIQDGVDTVDDGGMVKVARGAYRQSLTISGRCVTIQGGYAGGTYPGTGNFSDASRDPDPSTNQTVLDGNGAGIEVLCQGSGARGSVLTGFKICRGGANFRGGIVLRRVIAQRQ